jgi:hypothetical protein
VVKEIGQPREEPAAKSKLSPLHGNAVMANPAKIQTILRSSRDGHVPVWKVCIVRLEQMAKPIDPVVEQILEPVQRHPLVQIDARVIIAAPVPVLPKEKNGHLAELLKAPRVRMLQTAE